MLIGSQTVTAEPVTFPPFVCNRLSCWLRRMVLLAAAAAVYAFQLGVAAPPAHAACEENGVFWSMLDPVGDRAIAWGAFQEITLSSQTLKCVTREGTPDGLAGTGHTSRILLGGNSGNWFEAGHMNKICANGNPCQRAFISWKLAGVPGFQIESSVSCLNPGTRHGWLVQREAAQGAWHGWLDCYADGDFETDLGPSDLLGYNDGFAEGEGFERGFEGNGAHLEGPMREDHSNMQWLYPNFLGWRAANGLRCRADDSYRWDGRQTTPTSMTFVEVTRPPGCGGSTSAAVPVPARAARSHSSR